MKVLIGHRGVGKSKTLEKLEQKGFKTADLDKLIEEYFEKSISEIFEIEGEKAFREKELQVFKEIKEVDFISVGGGFDLSKIEDLNYQIIFLKRETDSLGRSFFDRPRLNKELKPLEEYQKRYSEREHKYKDSAHFEITLPESQDIINSVDESLTDILCGDFPKLDGWITYDCDKVLTDKLSVEYRTDLSSLEAIKELIKPGDIFSLRTEISQKELEGFLSRKIYIDIPVEFFKKYDLSDSLAEVFISSHDFLEESEIEEFMSLGHHLKWAPLVSDFQTLENCHELSESFDLSFLPRHQDPKKWQWYRSLTYNKQKFKFFRFSKGSDSNQPFWFQVLKTENALKGALLGSPVEHSLSPAFHYEYFKGNYYSIEISEDELTSKVLSFLYKLGIKAFSVTSPLKNKAAHLSQSKESSINTLYLRASKIHSKNTDSKAMTELYKNKQRLCIWGAGAIGKQFDDFLSDSKVFSVRSFSDQKIEGSFDALLWCAGKTDIEPQFKDEIPKKVYDIDYLESSKAKEFALIHSLEYESGLDFFKIQAKEQQSWWTQKEEEGKV